MALFAAKSEAATVRDSIIVTDASGKIYTLKQIGQVPVHRDTIYITEAVKIVHDTIYLPNTGKAGAVMTVQRKGVNNKRNDDYVMIGDDTVRVIIPERNLGRYDRGLYNHLFIPKKQWAFGLTTSYGGLQTQDLEFLKIVSDVDINGRTFSIKPYISYFFNHNSSIGVRMNYSNGQLDLNSLNMAFGEDLNFDLSDIKYKREAFSASVFYRHYIGLDSNRRFGIFNEVDLSFGGGTGQFVRNFNSAPRDSRTNTLECRLSYSPGLCVFIQENISFNLSFGIFGLYFKQEKQTVDGVEEGRRYVSGADFKFNVFNINLGIAVHL